MSGHVGDVERAFDTIHEAMRGLSRQNLELRKQVEQAKACKAIAEEECEDLRRQLMQLRGKSLRNGAKLLALQDSVGQDITDRVRFVDDGSPA
jgi:chromosome segregation ATPase